MQNNNISEQEFLAQYDAGRYDRPSVAADMVVFAVMERPEDNYRKLPEKELCLLLIRRAGHPFRGRWALPGGFVQPDETADRAARRELEEETGLREVHLEQLYTFSEPDRDPRTRVISCAYMALVDGARLQPVAGDDADRAQWFRCRVRELDARTETSADGCTRTARDEILLRAGTQELRCVVERRTVHTRQSSRREYRVIEDSGLAFDHARIIACAHDRLRGKLEYSGVALHLMPARFTLTELQQVHEAVLGRTLLKPAFRRKMAGLVRETDQFTANAGHRPSRLYERNWDGIADIIG